MWDQPLDVQVIEINNEIELLPKDNSSKSFLNEELCKDMLSKINENVNYLHLQSIKNKLNNNEPEVDLEYKVTTNGSLNNDKNGNFKIENVEIKKQIKQENEDEIQNSIIKIQNNNLSLINEENRFNFSVLNDELASIQQLNSNNQPNYHHQTSYQSNSDAINSIDIHPNINSTANRHSPTTNYSSSERELLKKYLRDATLANHIKPIVKIDANKKYSNSNIYPICSKTRGYCLIINNVDFKIYEQRKGSDLEAEYFKEIFKQLDFEILYYRNMTSLAMLECFKNIVKRPELSQHDTFVSIILTHGDDSRVLIGTDASRLKVDSFLHLFTNANCEQLANKPKLFFIQACRGNNHDFGIYDTVNLNTVSDAAPIKTSNTKKRKEIKELNRLNDVLIVNSTLDGFVSLRNEISGSWFGDALGVALCEHSKDFELQKLLSLVSLPFVLKSILN